MPLNGVLFCFSMKQTSSCNLDATMNAPTSSATSWYRASHDSLTTTKVLSSSPPIASADSTELSCHASTLPLGLPPLDRDRRIAIWRNQIQDLFNDGTINADQSAKFCALASDEWSMDDFNGHEIKKAVKAAKVVAETKRKELSRREIETMLKIERQFQDCVGCWDKEKEKEKGKKEIKAGGTKDSGDLEEFEEVEKP